MPTVLRIGPYKFVFFSTDRGEPAHIHVLRDRQAVKFWLDPVRLARNAGFPNHELKQVERLVVENRTTLLEGWHDYFGS